MAEAVRWAILTTMLVVVVAALPLSEVGLMSPLLEAEVADAKAATMALVAAEVALLAEVQQTRPMEPVAVQVARNPRRAQVVHQKGTSIRGITARIHWVVAVAADTTEEAPPIAMINVVVVARHTSLCCQMGRPLLGTAAHRAREEQHLLAPPLAFQLAVALV